MYAVIETGGKQYRVELGTELAVERLEADPGSTINLDRVLLVADGDNAQIGTPTVAEAVVTADVVRQDRGEKLIVFKYRPKARHRSKKGHRQELTVLRVADIRFNGRSAADEAGAQKQDRKAEQAKAEAAAQKKATADQELAAKLAADAAAKADTADGEQPATTKVSARKAAVTPKAEAAPKTAAKAAKPAAKTTGANKTTAAKTTASKTTSTKASATESKTSAEKTTAKPAAKKSTAAKSVAKPEKD